MGDAGDQLADRRQLLAVKQLLLGAAKIFISLASFLIEDGALDGTGNLTTDGDEQVHVGRRKLPRGAAAHDQAADDAVLGPQNHNVGINNLFFCLGIAENWRQGQSLCGEKRRMDGPDVLHQLRLHGDWWKAP